MYIPYLNMVLRMDIFTASGKYKALFKGKLQLLTGSWKHKSFYSASGMAIQSIQIM